MTATADRQPTQPGRAAPLGATPDRDGVNFAVHAPDAVGLELLLYAAPDAPEPDRVLDLDPARHHTDGYWHVRVPGPGHGQVYAWRARGPADPARGRRGDPAKVLLDPWARAVVGLEAWDRAAARRPGANGPTALRAVVVDPDRYDWEDDAPPAPDGREFIYELHVGAFTRHPSSGVDEGLRGTYAGLARRLEHVRSLGATAVELMPVHQFDHRDAPAGLVNYWGYSPVAWSAPHAGYSSDRSPAGPVDEFRDLVKAAHRAGLKVYIDVVYNHTAEGRARGPGDRLARPGRPRLVPGGRRRPLPGRDRLRQHRQRQPSGGAAHHRREPALVGARPARGRLPLRPRGGALPGHRGRTGGPAAGDRRHRHRPGPGRPPPRGRGLGRRGHPPGGRLSGPPLRLLERTLPRHGAALPQGRHGHHRGADGPHHRQPRPLRPRPATAPPTA